MMICPNCKNSIEKDTTECEWCGEKIVSKKANRRKRIEKMKHQMRKALNVLNILAVISAIIGVIAFSFTLYWVMKMGYDKYGDIEICIIGIIACLLVAILLSIPLKRNNNRFKSNNKL